MSPSPRFIVRWLTGAIRSPEDFDADDYRRHSPRFRGENFAKNLALVVKVKQLAADVVLTSDALDALEAIFPAGAAAGLRYPEAMMGSVNR